MAHLRERRSAVPEAVGRGGVRTACKKKETPLDLAQFGAVGPKALRAIGPGGTRRIDRGRTRGR